MEKTHRLAYGSSQNVSDLDVEIIKKKGLHDNATLPCFTA